MLDPLFLPTSQNSGRGEQQVLGERDVKRSLEKAFEQKGLLEVCANGVARLQRSREVTQTDIRRRLILLSYNNETRS
jgi:hypothetical protein